MGLNNRYCLKCKRKMKIFEMRYKSWGLRVCKRCKENDYDETIKALSQSRWKPY